MKITEEKTYHVTVDQARVKECNFRNDPDAFSVLLHGVTEDDYEGWGEIIFSHMQFDDGTISWEQAEETLRGLGVADGYPGNIPRAIEEGMQATFKAKKKVSGQGKEYLQIQVYPPRKTVDIEPKSMKAIWDRFHNVTDPEPEDAEPQADAMDDDDIPF